MVQAKWDNERQLYELELQNPAKDGKEESATWTEEAEVVVSAVGGFIKLGWPKDVFGEDYEKQTTFQGEVFHCGKWRYDIPLKGKRVGVIGNGCAVYVSPPSYIFRCLSDLLLLDTGPSSCQKYLKIPLLK